MLIITISYYLSIYHYQGNDDKLQIGTFCEGVHIKTHLYKGTDYKADVDV
jgi:hypothetical protein